MPPHGHEEAEQQDAEAYGQVPVADAGDWEDIAPGGCDVVDHDPDQAHYHQRDEEGHKPARIGLGALDGVFHAAGVFFLALNNAAHLRSHVLFVNALVEHGLHLVHGQAVLLVLGILASVGGLGLVRRLVFVIMELMLCHEVILLQ